MGKPRKNQDWKRYFAFVPKKLRGALIWNNGTDVRAINGLIGSDKKRGVRV